MNSRLDELLVKVNELIAEKKSEDRNNAKIVWIFAVIGVCVAIAAAVYGIYRFFAPDYLDDFEDDFDEDDLEDFFEDEDEDDEADEDEAEEADE